MGSVDPATIDEVRHQLLSFLRRQDDPALKSTGHILAQNLALVIEEPTRPRLQSSVCRALNAFEHAAHLCAFIRRGPSLLKARHRLRQTRKASKAAQSCETRPRTWPYISQELIADPIVRAVANIVPEKLPRECREEMGQSLFLQLAEGLDIRELPRAMLIAKANYFRQYPTKFAPRSLDAPVAHDSKATLADFIPGPDDDPEETFDE